MEVEAYMKYCIIEKGYDWPAFVYERSSVCRRWGYYELLLKYYQKIETFDSIEDAEKYIRKGLLQRIEENYTVVPLDNVQAFIAEEKLKSL